MTLRGLLLLILFGVFGFWIYSIVSEHTRPEVVAYKSFAAALQRGNTLAARQYVAANESQPMEAFQNYNQRQSQLFGDDAIAVFTYHRILRRMRSEDNRRSSMRVEQVTRFNRPGSERFYGMESVSVTHSVEMVKETGGWKIYRFFDTF